MNAQMRDPLADRKVRDPITVGRARLDDISGRLARLIKDNSPNGSRKIVFGIAGINTLATEAGLNADLMVKISRRIQQSGRNVDKELAQKLITLVLERQDVVLEMAAFRKANAMTLVNEKHDDLTLVRAASKSIQMGQEPKVVTDILKMLIADSRSIQMAGMAEAVRRT